MGNPTRRSMSFGLGALGLGRLAGLAGSTGSGAGLVTARATGAEAASAATPAPPRPDPGYHAWVAQVRRRALARGLAPATFDRAMAGARYLPEILETDRAQLTARRTLEAYIERAASADRVRIGRQKLEAHKALFDRIATRYGVAPQVVAAIWGVESGFGAALGTVPVLSALSTLGYASARTALFERELLAALDIVAAGDITAGGMRGSWAGAMGHTQFMPSTYLAHAVDFTGDGRRDIWADDPADALASAASYLAASGWTRDRLWGLEVRLPEGRDDLVTRDVPAWRTRGVTRAGGGELPDHGPATLLLPNGAGGVAFLVFANYAVLRTYNDSLKYALGVGHLSDRLAGGGALLGPGGSHRAELSFAARQDLQTRLTAAGFDTGGADGVIGDRTTAAIRAYEAARNLPVTGLATRALLDGLGG